MKRILLLLLLFCNPLFSVIYSQLPDTLFLRIPQLQKARIVLQINQKPPLGEEDKFTPNRGPWILKISTVNDARIRLTNTDGGTSTELENESKTYTINNNTLVEKAFAIEKNLRIDVRNNATGTTVKTYQLVYDQPGAATEIPGERFEASLFSVGSIIHDAVYLAKGSNVLIKSKILSHYGNNKTGDELLTEYVGNKFLNSIAADIIRRVGQQGSFSLGSVFSSIGGLDVTSFADGAAKFIVKRAKQELSIAFFQKFRNVIRETKDIGTIFPQTAGLLDAMDDEVYNYEKYIQNLRETFKKDITEIHRNLPGIIDNHPLFFSRHQPAKAALLTACYTAQELENGAHPGDILANYPIPYLDSIANKSFKGAIETIQLLSASLRDTSTKEESAYWVNIKQIRELVNDRQALKIYLGLLLQEAKIKYEGIAYEGTRLTDLLNNVADKYDEGFSIYNSYRSYVLRFGEKVDALNKMIKEYSNENTSDSAVLEKYAKYFRTSVDLIEYASHTSTLPVMNDHLPNLRFLLEKYFSVAYTAAELVADVNRKNYSSVINQAVRIYNLVTVRSVYAASATPDLSSSFIADESRFKKTLNNLVRYGSFMATIATAKNSSEVERAIEAAALPVGSSRIKRASDFNVALNAYAGLFYGVERIQDLDAGPWNANVYGITAPIGVATSFGHRLLFFKTKQEWSTSLFLSLLDLGAVAAFRFTDDSTAQIPTIRLKNIFSPGAFLSIGIPKTPLSWSFGAQVGPNLRKVSVDPGRGNDFSNNIYWRFSTSLAVDIPILNFHTRSK